MYGCLQTKVLECAEYWPVSCRRCVCVCLTLSAAGSPTVASWPDSLALSGSGAESAVVSVGALRPVGIHSHHRRYSSARPLGRPVRRR